MTTNFEQTERIIAVPAEAVGTMFPTLLAQYGQELPDAGRTILTIGGHPLTDGRLAFRCLWQADLAAAFDAGEIDGVEQLTEQQLADLLVTPEQSVGGTPVT
jgi:hypothetical protein